ncbi:CUE domain containing protein [Asbolus verrucosus]|uniref:CUE domain containing protein n=1 Tax=Asbolus verrucosus TaxID=1661398 RepID=A0A482VED5_ASBVE|nr:CUE domain containing protein [Asbolus verrucosus]
MASAITDKVKERRNRVLLGPLPEDFLRINISVQQQQEAADRQTAIALHHQLSGGQSYTNATGRLSVTVAQAKLAKNYGMTRMDPYARIRVGHCVYETHTDANGGETHEDWYPLNGKQGEGVEGMINLVLSYLIFPSYKYAAPKPVMVVPNITTNTLTPLKIYSAPPNTECPVPVLSESELKQIEEMFPNIDKEVIKTVFEANRGNKDGTINSLLQMAE